ncbi:hypothetical protein V1520DRAFT_331327 [Lipomyces starkeyi]
MKSIKQIASSIESGDQEKELEHLRKTFPTEAVNYFLNQWWVDGQCERWAERYICKHPNFGISTTSRVEGSHGALKRALTSSSGTLYAAAKKINHSGIERSQQLSVISSNENLFVRLEIRNQVETALLCTAISRSALELVYAEVMKKLHHQEEDGAIDECSCTVRSRYLLPCSHQIQLGLPLDVTHIHPRWRVQPTLSALNITPQHLQPDVLSVLKDPQTEIIQKVADRIEKVRRCGSCHRVGHNRRKCPKLLNQHSSSQGTDECVLTQTANTIEEMAENDAVDDTALEDDEAFHNHDEDDATFEAMWADALALL